MTRDAHSAHSDPQTARILSPTGGPAGEGERDGARRDGSGGDEGGHIERLIITIDGPAGTGKSSVARTLANRPGPRVPRHRRHVPAAAALAIDRGLKPDAPAAIVRVSETHRNPL